MFYYQKLKLYPVLMTLVKDVYQISSSFPSQEKYGLTAQIRRASVSVLSNLVEGTSRTSYKEKIRFIEICYGSILEVHVQLSIAHELDYITFENIKKMHSLITDSCKMMSGLKRSFETKRAK